MGIHPKFIALAITFALAQPLGIAQPAQAATAQTATSSYSFTREFYSAELSTCVKLTVQGKLTALAYAVPVKGGTSYRLTDVATHSPSLMATTYKNCGTTTTRRVDGITFSQAYYATQCTTNTSAGISIGASTSGASFGLSASATQQCGTVTLAKRSSNYRSTAGNEYHQYNTGAVITWTSTYASSYNKQDVKLCIRPHVTFRVYKGTSDDGDTLVFPAQCVGFPG